jgi:signal transduction histidine kinase
MNISYETDDIEPQLPKDSRTVVFRMFQEIISNCLKHSKANTIEVKFLGEDFLLQIKDDGKGFDKNIVLVERKGFGLKNIIRRAALASLVCEIQSAPEQGAIFRIRQERAKKLR